MAKTSSSPSSNIAPSGPSTFVELIEPVLALLPLSQVADLKRGSKLWASLLQSASVKRLCAAAHPVTAFRGFGLVGWHHEKEEVMQTSLFDMEPHEWTYVELAGFPEEDYKDALCASHSGLVCFVPMTRRPNVPAISSAALPILVCNPLTSQWKSLPLSPLAGKRQIVLVQLVVDEDTMCYKVIVVHSRGAFCYESSDALWSKMNAGVVYGAANSLRRGQQDPFVFDCSRKELHNVTLRTLYSNTRVCVLVKDRLFVLDSRIVPGTPWGTYSLRECGWPRSTEFNEELRTLRVHSGRLRFLYEDAKDHDYVAALLPSNDFVLLAWDYTDPAMALDFPDEQIKLYDKSAGQWYDIPTFECGDSFTLVGVLDSALMCDMRWDVTL